MEDDKREANGHQSDGETTSELTTITTNSNNEQSRVTPESPVNMTSETKTLTNDTAESHSNITPTETETCTDDIPESHTQILSETHAKVTPEPPSNIVLETETHTDDISESHTIFTDDKSGLPNTNEDPLLINCLEPRPLSNEGQQSPKEIQKTLLQKAKFASTNGTFDGCGPQDDDDKPVPNRRGSDQKRSFGFSSLFKRKREGSNVEVLVAANSTTGLILEGRPKGLPAKSALEQKRHQKLYDEMIAAAKKRELRHAEESLKRELRKQTKDEMMADAQRRWHDILPKFESLRHTKEVKELWWYGLPPGIRGTIWKKAIGNDLHISPELYQICLKRCTDRLELAEQRGRSDSVASVKSLSRENSVEVIHLDVLRTFPTLGFFQEGGPYHESLRDILGAYACYRPDIGYVQGMSFLAGVLLLNMDIADAFICMANLLNRASYLAFFKVEHELMKPYFNAFMVFLKDNLPQLHSHFTALSYTPEFYLIEWIVTLYTRNLPLDIACRVWDLFCRDGDVFLYRTALGILHMYQSHLLEFGSIEEVGQFLNKLPPNMDCDDLFHNIGAVTITEKKFNLLLTQNR